MPVLGTGYFTSRPDRFCVSLCLGNLILRKPCSMNGAERRLADRFSLKIPLRVRILKSAIQDHEAESLNVSMRGIYFRTDLPLREGTPVHLIFEMPPDVTRKP